MSRPFVILKSPHSGKDIAPYHMSAARRLLCTNTSEIYVPADMFMRRKCADVCDHAAVNTVVLREGQSSPLVLPRVGSQLPRTRLKVSRIGSKPLRMLSKPLQTRSTPPRMRSKLPRTRLKLLPRTRPRRKTPRLLPVIPRRGKRKLPLSADRTAAARPQRIKARQKQSLRPQRRSRSLPSAVPLRERVRYEAVRRRRPHWRG